MQLGWIGWRFFFFRFVIALWNSSKWSEGKDGRDRKKKRVTYTTCTMYGNAGFLLEINITSRFIALSTWACSLKPDRNWNMQISTQLNEKIKTLLFWLSSKNRILVWTKHFQEKIHFKNEQDGKGRLRAMIFFLIINWNKRTHLIRRGKTWWKNDDSLEKNECALEIVNVRLTAATFQTRLDRLALSR
jgi:hypothetical protein